MFTWALFYYFIFALKMRFLLKVIPSRPPGINCTIKALSYQSIELSKSRVIEVSRFYRRDHLELIAPSKLRAIEVSSYRSLKVIPSRPPGINYPFALANRYEFISASKPVSYLFLISDTIPAT